MVQYVYGEKIERATKGAIIALHVFGMLCTVTSLILCILNGALVVILAGFVLCSCTLSEKKLVGTWEIEKKTVYVSVPRQLGRTSYEYKNKKLTSGDWTFEK